MTMTTATRMVPPPHSFYDNQEEEDENGKTKGLAMQTHLDPSEYFFSLFFNAILISSYNSMHLLL